MNRRLALSVLVGVFFALTGSGVGATAASPRLALVVQNHSREVITIGPLGEEPQVIAGLKLVGPGAIPSWSANGDRLAFSAEKENDDDSVLGVVGADGSNLHVYEQIPVELGDPVMAPDGRSAAYARVRVRRSGKKTYTVTTSIWSFDFEEEVARRLTPWGGEFLIPSSYSPDGSTLAATGWDFRRFRAVAIDLRSARTSLLAHNAKDPMYSPDGSSFAFLRSRPWVPSRGKARASSMAELRVGRVGVQARSRSLVRMRGLISPPSWDPSGKRIAFVHAGLDEFGGWSSEKGNGLMAVNADGTCRTMLFADPHLTLYGAAWESGLNREAGPIAC